MTDTRITHLRSCLRGTYVFGESLGRGELTSAFRVHHLDLDRPEVIKVVSDDLCQSQSLRERFVVEAALVARLQHPNIAQVYDYGDQDGILWYTMQVVEGRTLASDHLSRGSYPVRAAVQVLIRALTGLAHSHRLGIVHRNIRPSNIMLAEDQLFLMDFAIAKPAEGVLFGGDRRVGKPEYVPPELLAANAVPQHGLDGRCDIYSLGSVLYELLAGVPPYQAQEATAPPTREDDPLCVYRADVDVQLASIVRRALQRRPEDRYGSADEMLAALSEYVGADRAESRPLPSASAFPPSSDPLAGGASAPGPDILSWSPGEAASEPPGGTRAGISSAARPRPLAGGSARASGRGRGRRGALLQAALVVVTVACALMGWWVLNGRQEVAATATEKAVQARTEPIERSSDRIEGSPETTSEGTSELPPSASGIQGVNAPSEAGGAGDSTSPSSQGLSEPATGEAMRPLAMVPAKAMTTIEPVLAPEEVAVCSGQSVILSLQVLATGRVGSARVLQEADSVCTEAARIAANDYRFDPARDAKGLPVASSAIVSISFQ